MKERIISGIFLCLVLIPLVIAGGRPFQIAVGSLAILGLKEMIDLKKSHNKIPSGIILFSLCMLLFLIFYEFEMHPLSISYTTLAILSIGLLIPTLIPYKNKIYETKDGFYLMGLILFLGSAFHAIVELRNQKIIFLGYLIIIPMITDIFAYFIGKFFGKRKIAPNISPNKTLAGCIGGSIMGSVIGTLFYVLMISKTEILEIIIISFILSIIGQLGDLLFSKIKRENEVKDFSNLIPGHGGVLDRFDSLIFVILAFIILKRFI